MLDVLVIEFRVCDARGFFCEIFNGWAFNETFGKDVIFLRIIKGRLIQWTFGFVFHVAVDFRKNLLSFKHWEGVS